MRKKSCGLNPLEDYMTSIDETQQIVHALSTEKGWWDVYKGTTDEIIAKVALIMTEAAEAIEDARVTPPDELCLWKVEENGKPVGFPTEIADVVIRCMDLAEKMGFSLEMLIAAKTDYNRTRARKHGKLA